MYKKCLGFDIRLKAEDYVNDIWNKELKERLLLNTGIKWPLTVDTSLWPSFFLYSNEALSFKNLSVAESIKVQPKEDRHEGLWLWQDLPKMKEFFKKNIKSKAGIIIGMELISENPIEMDKNLPYVLTYNDSNVTIPKNWIFLGFDVADKGRSRTSGLVNCSYSKSEKTILIEEWASSLNEYGLFSDIEKVWEFKKMTDKRIPSHAPFYVYGLYRAPETKP